MDRVTFPKDIENDLRLWLTSDPGGHERAAVGLFRRYDRVDEAFPKSARWVAVEFLRIEGDWLISSSPTHVRFSLREFPELYWRCECEGLQLGFIHSHPHGHNKFSETDDQNELNILHGFSGANGLGAALLALILVDGKWIGRVRSAQDRENPKAVRHVAVLGDEYQLHIDEQKAIDEAYLRQAAAFGEPFNQRLASLRVGVVGLGGTGSPLATNLVRSGIGELLIIDGDRVERTNLNRTSGYTVENIRDFKASALEVSLNQIGLPTHIFSEVAFIHESARSVDLLSGCDIIFGCTDDVVGREILNAAAHYYGIPLIDVGLTGQVDDDEHGHPFLRDHRARVSLVIPGNFPCLRCQRVVTDEKLRAEAFFKDNPDKRGLPAEVLKKEFYITGGGVQAPGVGPFTTIAANLALATLFDLAQPFRRIDTEELSKGNLWIDFIHMTIYSNDYVCLANCHICGPQGIDIGSFERERLGMPSLGKLNG